MRIVAPKDLEELAHNESDGWYPRGIAKAYRRRYGKMIVANDVRDIMAIGGYHFEKLQIKWEEIHSIRLNIQRRLEFYIDKEWVTHIIRLKRISNHYQ